MKLLICRHYLILTPRVNLRLIDQILLLVIMWKILVRIHGVGRVTLLENIRVISLNVAISNNLTYWSVQILTPWRTLIRLADTLIMRNLITLPIWILKSFESLLAMFLHEFLDYWETLIRTRMLLFGAMGTRKKSIAPLFILDPLKHIFQAMLAKVVAACKFTRNFFI